MDPVDGPETRTEVHLEPPAKRAKQVLRGGQTDPLRGVSLAGIAPVARIRGEPRGLRPPVGGHIHNQFPIVSLAGSHGDPASPRHGGQAPMPDV